MTTTTTSKTYPRRTLRGTFGQPVRTDCWHDSDLGGQEAARILAGLGATGVYVNTFGVAYGYIHGVEVLVSEHSPVRVQFNGCTLVTRRFWTQPGGNFVRVEGGSF